MHIGNLCTFKESESEFGNVACQESLERYQNVNEYNVNDYNGRPVKKLCNFNNSNRLGCLPEKPTQSSQPNQPTQSSQPNQPTQPELSERFQNGKEKFRVGGVCNNGEDPQADGTCADGTPVAAVLPNWVKACKDGSHPRDPLDPDGKGDVYTWCEDGSEPKCETGLNVNPGTGKCGDGTDPKCPTGVNTFDTPCKDDAPGLLGKEGYWQKKNNANNNSNGHYYVVYPDTSYANSNYYSNTNGNAAYYYLSALLMFFIFFGLLMSLIKKSAKK